MLYLLNQDKNRPFTEKCQNLYLLIKNTIILLYYSLFFFNLYLINIIANVIRQFLWKFIYYGSFIEVQNLKKKYEKESRY